MLSKMIITLNTITEAVKQKKFKEALNLIIKIKDHEKNFQLISLKGFIFLNLKEFKKSYEAYSLAINLNNNSFICFDSRAAVLFELGKFSDAISDYKNSLKINNQNFETFENIGKCYSNLGENEKAFEYYNLALNLKKDDKKIIELIAEKLTIIKNSKEKFNEISIIDNTIKNFEIKFDLNFKIYDSKIKKFFNYANDLINKKFPNLYFNQTQIFRKNNLNLNCDRHFIVFNNYKVIPEFCFSCFKVLINVQTVIDLIKLFIIFNKIKLPENNLRKCMIDMRAFTNENYKGFIYCRSLDEAEKIKVLLEDTLEKTIENKVVVRVKRGCTEFNNEFPGYENTKQDFIKYNHKWKKYEQNIDNKFPKFQHMKKNIETLNQISFHDIMIIKNWLFFAKLTNDLTYENISKELIENPVITKIVKKNKNNSL